MREEQVESLKAAYAAFKRGEPDRVRELIAGDMILHRAEPDDATFRGPDGFFEAVADWSGQFEDWSIEDEELEVYPGGAVIRTRQSGRPRGGAGVIEQDFWIAHVFEGGRITRMGIYADRATALEFVGEAAS